MMMLGLRTNLLTATNGRGRYEEIWGETLRYTADGVNHTAQAGEESAVERNGGEKVDLEADDQHILGARVLRYTAKERRDGKLDATARLAIYGGRSQQVPGGHRVMDIEWNQRTKAFDIKPTVHVKTIDVDDSEFPLHKLPIENDSCHRFDQFVDRFSKQTTSVDIYRVRSLLDHRFLGKGKQKKLQYLVHWHGYSKTEATWEPTEFVSKHGAKRLAEEYHSVHKINNIVLSDELQGSVELMRRHKLAYTVDECVDAYKLELDAVVGRRLVELHGAERERVLREERAPRLRMNPKPKPDRLKMRLLVMGHTEPKSWTEGKSLDAPKPMASSIKLLIAMQDEVYECGSDEPEELATGDVRTAFLKGDEYGEGEPPRYVAYKAHRNARVRVFRLRGSLYGQRDAPIRWHETLRGWLVDTQGFVQSCNDPTMYRHPVTKVRLAVGTDDFLARGQRKVLQEFYRAADVRFGLKHWGFVEPGAPKVFLGLNISTGESADGTRRVLVDQNADMQCFLQEHCEPGWTPLKSPMPKKDEMCVESAELTGTRATRFRSLLMTISYYAYKYNKAGPVAASE
jgi:hypothetical protein